MLTPAQLAALRQEYSERELRRKDLDPDPMRQFRAWLEEAITCEIAEPNGMTLATVDKEGQPWTRIVLLKACDERGFVFFTNYHGAKGLHLAANPKAALTFWWSALERQVNVTGQVAKVPREEADAYFATRPLNSQLGAWASRQSEIVADRGQLERQFEEVRARFAGQQTPLPPHWGGFCLRPVTIEFWQGRPNRLHDRLRYLRGTGDQWRIERLSP